MSERILRHGFRDTTWTPCIVRAERTRIVRGLITNISGTGAELRCKFPLEQDQKIEVFAPSEDARRLATIVRDDGNIFGLEWSSWLSVDDI